MTFVVVSDSFGLFTGFLFGKELTVLFTRRSYSTIEARSVMNLDSYVNDNNFYTYSFLRFSESETVYQITIGQYKTDIVHN